MIPLAALVAICTGRAPAALEPRDEAFLEDLQHRSFLYFWEQADPATGLVADRAGADGGPSAAMRSRGVASVAATGFALTGLCIAERRGWVTHDQAYARTLATLRFLHDRVPAERGFFYHFLNQRNGMRAWRCELSSVDTALLLAGALTARQHYKGTEAEQLATELYEHVDWPWMLAGGTTLSMGWKPEAGGRFLEARWDRFSEGWMIYLLALGSPTMPLPAESWRAWKREPVVTYAGRTFLQHPPLFVHQFPQAWFGVRGTWDGTTDFWQNSVDATLAHRQFCIDLKSRFPKFGADLWGITSSDSQKGYVGWGGPPATDNLDGTVVPCAVAGSLPFAAAECLRTLRHMRETYGDQVWKRYGFADAFNPHTDWVAPDCVGIDVGITLLMAENLRGGWVWECFGRNEEVRAALRAAGFRAKD